MVNQHRDCWSHLQIQHRLSRVVDEVAGQGSRSSAVGQDDGVFGVLAPLDEEFSGKSRLEVWLAAKHHLGAGNPGQVCQTVAQGQVTELEGVVSLVLKTPHELVTHPLHLQRDSRLTVMTGEKQFYAQGSHTFYQFQKYFHTIFTL